MTLNPKISIIAVLIINVFFFLIINTNATLMDYADKGYDFNNWTQSDIIFATVGGNIDNKISEYNNKGFGNTLNQSDVIAAQEDLGIYDRIETLFSRNPVTKFVNFLVSAQIPVATMNTYIVDNIDISILKTLASLFIWSWQTVIVLMWIGLLFWRTKE